MTVKRIQCRPPDNAQTEGYHLILPGRCVPGGFAMQCDKNDYRGLLAALEGLTGKKAVDSEAMNVKKN
jgi:hypothetical protein